MLRRVALRLPSLLSRTQQVRLFSAGGSPLNISSDNAGHRYAFGDEAQVDDSAGWNDESEKYNKYGQYFILPVLLLGVVMVILEYTHPEEHHHGNPSPYAHIRTKPFAWKNDCTFMDSACHEAVKAAARGEHVESAGHH